MRIFIVRSNVSESRWEPPEEGYVSLTEQKKAEEKELKNKKEEERKRKAEEVRMKEEERARLERERMKSRRVKEEDTKTAETPMPVLGPAPRVDPYGSWKPVEIRYHMSYNKVIFIVSKCFW
jgi:hypothetical protein